MLTAIRKRFPPPIVFHIDCNGGYDLKEDMEFLSSLDQYELAMIEQPLNPTTGGNAGDLLDHAELASIIKTPICDLLNAPSSLGVLRCSTSNLVDAGVSLQHCKSWHWRNNMSVLASIALHIVWRCCQAN
jgi:hypothetical protein